MDVKIGELEDLFERYRSSQDLRALAKLFDLAAPELLRLAVHMAPDVASAEDLVQQTFLAAIERPKRWRAGEPLLPWLFGILSKLAKKQRRNARRTPEPDRLAPRSATDPARHALDAETQSAIRSALEELPELYREVVRASLLDEKPPHEIARELDRAPGTVRMQLLRGLELLRRALPAGLAGGALVFCGTRGEAALKAAVLEKAAAHAALGAAAATSTAILGGLLVSTKTLVALAVGVVGLCAWMLWPYPDSHPGIEYGQDIYGNPIRIHTDTGEVERVAPALAGEADGARTEVAAAPRGLAASAKLPGLFLVGRLLDVEPGDAAGVELEASLPGFGQAKGKARADGSFEIDLGSVLGGARMQTQVDGRLVEIVLPASKPSQPVTRVEVWARHARYISEQDVVQLAQPFELPKDGERREISCEIRMRLAALVTGRVRVPDGHDVKQVDVGLRGESPVGQDGLLWDLEHANCDTEGRYTIKSVREGRIVVHASLTGLLPVQAVIVLAKGATLELPDIVLEEGNASIRGRVDLPARLEQRQTGSVDMGSGPVAILGRELSVQANRVEPEAKGSQEGGAPQTVLDSRTVRTLRELRGGAQLETQSCPVADDGSFELRGLEPGRWRLHIDGLGGQGVLPGFEWPVVVAPAAGVVLGEDLGSIAVHVRDSKGPVAGAHVTLGDGSTWTTYTSDAEGEVLVAGDVQRDYRGGCTGERRDQVSFELPSAGRPREAQQEVVIADAAPAARIVLRAKVQGGPQRVHVELESLDETKQQPRSEVLTLHEGRYVVENVAPGRWKIAVGPVEERMPVAFYGGYQITERFEAALISGGTFEAQLVCETGGRFQFTVGTDASLLSNGVGCQLVRLDGGLVEPPIFVSSLSGEGFGVFSGSPHLMIMGKETRVALQDCLAPGTYELRIPSAKVRAAPLRFEIKAGETTQGEWKIELVER